MKLPWVSWLERRKEEARVLAYGSCSTHIVFATYRRSFLEELEALSVKDIVDYTKDVEKHLRTYHEVTYVINCTGSKYAGELWGFRVLEGGDYLTLRLEYCGLVLQVLYLLCRRGLLNPPLIDLSVELAEKRVFLGDVCW